MAEDHRIPAIEPEGDLPVATGALASHFNGTERCPLDLDVEFLDRGDKHVPSIGLASKDGREQAHHRGPLDWNPLVIPAAVAGDAHA